MTMKELSVMSESELDALEFQMVMRGNLNAASRIADVKKYYHKRVRVVKGRKVAHGIEGECFWMCAYDNSKYGDPWGIYTSVRIGIKDDSGEVYWTSLNNVERI